MHTFSEKLARKPEPNGILLEPSCASEPFGRTVVILGTEMTLGAVLDHDVNQTNSKAETGDPRGNPPIIFDAVRSIISVGFKVHISLFEVRFLEKETMKVLTPRLDQVLQLHSQF